MSTLKVDTIATRTGSGNITASNTIAGNLTGNVTGNLTGNSTVGGTLGVTGLITASAGMAVGGTGSANTLDDYEEGTWTPTIEREDDDTTLTVGYNTGDGGTKGRYTKIGNIVTFQCTVAVTSVSGGNSSHSLVINNLPFTSADYQTRSNGGANMTYNANTGTVSFGIVLGSSTKLRFYSAGSTSVKTNAVQSNTHLQMYGQYEVA